MPKDLVHQFSVSADELWAAVQAAAARPGPMRPTAWDHAGRSVQLSVDMTAFSWGQNVIVWVGPWPPGSALQMRASSKFLPSVADIGKIDRLFGTLVDTVRIVLNDPPGWRPDPGGIHELRYWDGNIWTPHVRNGDVATVDPAGGAPAPAPAAVPQPVSAAWVADPTGRHELRYWDGSKWTPYVSDGGVQSDDPV